MMPRDIVMLTICEKIEKDREEARVELIRTNIRESNRLYAEAMKKLRDAANA